MTGYLRRPVSFADFVESGMWFSITVSSLPFLLTGLIAVFGTLLTYLKEVIYLYCGSFIFYILFISGLYTFRWYFEYLPEAFLPPLVPYIRNRRNKTLILKAAAPNKSNPIVNLNSVGSPNPKNNNNA